MKDMNDRMDEIADAMQVDYYKARIGVDGIWEGEKPLFFPVLVKVGFNHTLHQIECLHGVRGATFNIAKVSDDLLSALLPNCTSCGNAAIDWVEREANPRSYEIDDERSQDEQEQQEEPPRKWDWKGWLSIVLGFIGLAK